MKHWLGWLVGFVLFPMFSIQAEELSQLRGFADHLFQQGDYYRAITEYERFLYLAPTEESQAPDVRLRIATAYHYGQKWEAANQRFQQLLTSIENQPEAAKWSTLYLADIANQQKLTFLSTDYLEAFVAKWPNDSRSRAAASQLILNQLHAGHVEEARQLIAKQAEANAIAMTPITLEDIDTFVNLPRKSKLTAGVFSAILPGAGQAYTRHWSDAFWSFTLNAIFIGGTYAAFANDEEVLGCFLGFFETTWYMGNIYNAINGVRQYNRTQEERFTRNITIRYGLIFPPKMEGAAGPAFGVGKSF